VEFSRDPASDAYSILGLQLGKSMHRKVKK